MFLVEWAGPGGQSGRAEVSDEESLKALLERARIVVDDWRVVSVGMRRRVFTSLVVRARHGDGSATTIYVSKV